MSGGLFLLLRLLWLEALCWLLAVMEAGPGSRSTPCEWSPGSAHWACGVRWANTWEVLSMSRRDPHWQGLLASSQIGSFLLESFHRPKILFQLGIFLENAFQIPDNMT